MKKKFQPIIVVKITAILMLFWALADNLYSYYQILRWVITGVIGYSAYLAYKQSETEWAWIFGIIAVLFNPIVPIYFDRETWAVIDLIVALVIFINILQLKVFRKGH